MQEPEEPLMYNFIMTWPMSARFSLCCVARIWGLRVVREDGGRGRGMLVSGRSVAAPFARKILFSLFLLLLPQISPQFLLAQSRLGGGGGGHAQGEGFR